MLRLANGSAEGRYKIVYEDYEKFLKPFQLDPLLKHELGQVVKGFKSAKPKLSHRLVNKVDTKIWKAEKESHLALGCIASLSWMLKAVSSQIAKFNNLLNANCQPETCYKFKEVDLGSLSNMVQMAQDASMETLDLEARQIVNIKLARQQLWLAKTH